MCARGLVGEETDSYSTASSYVGIYGLLQFVALKGQSDAQPHSKSHIRSIFYPLPLKYYSTTSRGPAVCLCPNVCLCSPVAIILIEALQALDASSHKFSSRQSPEVLVLSFPTPLISPSRQTQSPTSRCQHLIGRIALFFIPRQRPCIVVSFWFIRQKAFARVSLPGALCHPPFFSSWSPSTQNRNCKCP